MTDASARPSDADQRKRENRPTFGPGRRAVDEFAVPGLGCGLGSYSARANSIGRADFRCFNRFGRNEQCSFDFKFYFSEAILIIFV